MKRRFKNMKSVKRVLSVAVAVLLIAMMMIPAVSAAGYSITLNCDLPGYEYTIYKVADYRSDTGAFTTTYAALESEVETSKESTATLLTACKDVDFTSSVATFNTDGATTEHPATKTLDDVDAGIYYVKMTKKSPNFKSLTQDAIVVFPNKRGNASETLNLSEKISEGEPNVSKDFKVGDTLTKEDQTRGTVDTDTFKSKAITYVLTADVPASTVNKYIITDRMDDGLKAVTKDNITVTLNGTTALDFEFLPSDRSDINVAKDDTVNKQYGTTGNTFGISINASKLADPAFYTAGNKVVVEFTTELDYAKATVGSPIVNHDDLIYGNDSALNVRPGNDVTVKTYKVVAKKVDATTKAALAGAKFGLYQDADCTKLIAESPETGNDGIADFGVKLPAGTYYIKEISAPDKYNLNTEIKSVTLGDSNANATVTVEDTLAKLPSTGGNGTMMFTIIGGSLVLLAAALFVIVMKKKSSAK